MVTKTKAVAVAVAGNNVDNNDDDGYATIATIISNRT